jgi:GMP synthase-like glutamine amidotransferase
LRVIFSNLEQLFLIHHTTLSKIYDREKLLVNSFHHQAVSEPGERFKVSATAPDGTIEAIESCEFKSIIGVQWHPECLTEGKPLFDWLVAEAENFSQTKDMHKRILSLDTHCDTPMFFPQGIHFDQRDSRILVDLQKMNEGHQDATIMVAYGRKWAEVLGFNLFASGQGTSVHPAPVKG